MAKNSKLVFIGLHVIAWLIFVGLSIEACALLVNFVFSIVKPEWVQNLYQKLDLSQMFNKSKMVFFGVYGFILSISFLKAILFYVLIQLLIKLDLSQPFNMGVAKKFTSVCYFTLSIGLLGIVAAEISKSLTYQGFEMYKLTHFWDDSHAFILMTAVIYILAVIFKRGVEIQSENELTV